MRFSFAADTKKKRKLDFIKSSVSSAPSKLAALTTKGSGGRRPNLLIIGCDFHPSVQQIAFIDAETGECGERRLAHCAEAEQFYREVKQKGVSVRVGIEATGQSRWFERLLAQLNFE